MRSKTCIWPRKSPWPEPITVTRNLKDLLAMNMPATALKETRLTRAQKIGLHLTCISEQRSRGTLRPEFCSFYWSGIRRELTKEVLAPQ